MASATVTPRDVAHGVSQPEKVEELMGKLDELFEQYLHTLDQYQKARQDLTKSLSSGFMSLAQANFNTKGRRYGQDYYDERMQAQRVVTISSTADDEALHFTCEEVKHEKSDEINKDAEDDQEDEKPVHRPSCVLKDPLRWFGVLVPPALRSAKASFAHAVERPVADLVTLQHKLRSQEIEIGRARKSIKKLEKI